MTLRHKHLVPLAAIAWIGLAVSSIPAHAQKPPAFACAPGEKLFTAANGTNDNFAGTTDPKPHPSNQFISAVGLLAASNIYDQTSSNYKFGDTFTLPPGPDQITKVRVTTRLKPLTGQPDNDGISFSGKLQFTPGHFSLGLNTLTPGWGTTQTAAKLFAIDFDTSGTQVHVNGAPFNAGATYATFYADLNANRVLHVYVQDDTSVDFVGIEGCVKPPAPKYDLVASKKREGSSAFILNVHNAGSQIMPTGHIDIVEVVPAGLTLTGASLGPWTCPGTVFPVAGPDAFTCSYQIPAAGIAPNANLPQLVFKSEGKSECPNCMRAKLYLKSVSDGVKPVEEGDMKNSASCTM